MNRGKPAPRLASSQRLNNNVNNNLEKSGRLVAYFFVFVFAIKIPIVIQDLLRTCALASNTEIDSHAL